MRRLASAVVLSSLAVLVLPTSAGAIIQMDKGIAGARLGNTKSQVKTALGQPKKVRHGTNDFGAFTTYTFAGKIKVFFQSGNRVTSVNTRGRGDRTSSGKGVGSTRAAVDRIKGVKCERFFNVGPVHCHTGTFGAGTIVTDFIVRNGRVTRVTVGRVID